MATPNLKDVQALILKGHGRNYLRCVFIRFTKDSDEITKWISSFVARRVTSATEQINDAAAYRQGARRDISSNIYCFFLSKSGYRKIGNQAPTDTSFSDSMRSENSINRLNDPVLRDWEVNYQDNIDAMILIADNAHQNLQVFEDQIRESLNEETGRVMFTEDGNIMRPCGYPVEHFGFADGISQPQFLDEENKLSGNWNLVLTKEQDGGYGSYLVFRKLEQNVLKFNNSVKTLAGEMGISREMVEAQIIGRFKNGMPLTYSDKETPYKFNYSSKHLYSDEEGRRCPLHAHIRKSNPRTKSSEKRRIARRGITYDDFGRNPLLTDQPEKDVGILFMCFQASIVNQFEHIQIEWCNKENEPDKNAGIDPIIGVKKGKINKQKWNKTWDSKNNKHAALMNGSVNFKGGEYFFSPSISFLKGLNLTGKDQDEEGLNKEKGNYYSKNNFWLRQSWKYS